MLKRIGVLGSLLVLVLAAAGCGNNGGGSEASNTTSGGSARVTLNEDYADALPVSSQLAIGTLMLEGTDNAVTVEQAGELLTPWQMLQALQSSGTAAQAELDAVLNQIQGAMTNEQLTAIKEMKITLASMQQLAQEQGLGMGVAGGTGGFQPPAGAFVFGGEGSEGGPQSSAGTTRGGASDRGGGGGFQPPAGGAFIGGDPGAAFGEGSNQNSEEQQAAQAEQMNRLANTMMTRMVVSLLEARAKGETWEIAAPDRGFELQRTLLAAITEATALDQQEIMTQSSEGKTLLEIAQASGADVDEIVAQVVAAETEWVNQAVADGTMEQGDADEWLGNLEVQVRALMEQPLQFRGRGAPGGTPEPEQP